LAGSSNTNVIKFKKTKFNINIVLIGFLIIYVVFYIVSFFNKEYIGIYQVNEKQMSDNNTIVGIAIREEDIYTAPSSGYVSFYNKRGSKIGKNGTLFSIDPTGEVNDILGEINDKSSISEEQIRSIRAEISSYNNNFNYADYNQIYDFKYTIESLALTGMSEKAVKKIATSDNASSFDIEKASSSGIVAYWTDSLEGINKDTITTDSFNEANNKKEMLKTSDQVSQGSNVCKVVTSEDWEIIIQITDEQKKKIEEREIVKFRFCKDDIELNVPYEIFSKDGVFYARLFLNNYLSRYIDDRYIDIELLLNSAEGLKIPVSSQLEKSCYIAPVSYLTKGDNNNKDVLCYEVVNEDGTLSTANIESFAYCDEEYVYIDGMLIQPGLQLINTTTNERFTIGEMRSLKGVYCVNNGFCQFKCIEIIYENEEYYIIKKDTAYGVDIYDNIVINPDLINENDIIY